MLDTIYEFGSVQYFLLLGVLVFARSCDLASTWLATPHLQLEANPISAWLGWRRGIILNIVLCLLLARHVVPGVMLTTTSVLVAARNLENAWLMRSMGESAYQSWMALQLHRTHASLVLGCYWGNGLLYFLLGLAIIFFSPNVIALSIGFGVLGYAFAVVTFTSLSIWRSKRRIRYTRPTDWL